MQLKISSEWVKVQFYPENFQYRKQHQGLVELQDLSGPWSDPA